MKKLFAYANQYVAESDWKDMALLKFCLCAMGILIGVNVAPKHKKPVACGAVLVFIATYIPLMRKFINIILGSENEFEEE